MKYIATINGNEYLIEYDEQQEIYVNGERFKIDLDKVGEGNLYSLLLNQRSLEVAATVTDRDSWEIMLGGEAYAVKVQDERAYRLAKARGELDADSGTVPTKSPMPGVIVRVPVSAGDVIGKGDTLVILESMKMENELKATRDGIILEVKVSAGDSVEKDAVLVVVGDVEVE